MKKIKNLYVKRFGIKLKILRTQKGMTRKEFTEKTGFSKSLVAKIEDGEIISPSKETKETIYKALELTDEEIEYLDDDPKMFYYEEDDDMRIDLTIPKKMKESGSKSKNIIEYYSDRISPKNLYMLAFCAEAIYNYEHPENAKEGLKQYNEFMSEYSLKWRQDVNKKRTDEIHKQYDDALSQYLEEKVARNDLIVTTDELIENIKPQFKKTITTKKINNLCELGILKISKEGKKRVYILNKEKF